MSTPYADLADRAELPLASLSFENVYWRIGPPYGLGIDFRARGHYLHPGTQDHGDALLGRHILPDDLLLFDRTRVAPEHDAIQLVKADDRTWVPRVCRVLPDGAVEFHAAAPGYPTLTGERRIVGTLAAVVRATDGQEATR